MPRYIYDKLTVACLNAVDYPPTEIRAAVEHLKTIEQAKFTGLQAETDTTVGHYKLRARALIPLSDIIGKTPREVWAMFDAKVDADRASLAARDGRL